MAETESSRSSKDFALPTPRRVLTAPVLHTAAVQQEVPAGRDGLVETLYTHPYAKIVSFTAGSRPFPLSPGRGFTPPAEPEPGSLSWSSQLERTIAVGPFQIYRAPGSVAFLSCGSALQPILPKSQCWCVDEMSSKFVLQIRRPQYWRIELPVSGVDDIDRSQLLRDVFDKILQFEKTECPFKRTFTVELPERPQTPLKKRPWTPVQKSFASLPPTPTTPRPTAEADAKPEGTALRENRPITPLRENRLIAPLRENQPTQQIVMEKTRQDKSRQGLAIANVAAAELETRTSGAGTAEVKAEEVAYPQDGKMARFAPLQEEVIKHQPPADIPRPARQEAAVEALIEPAVETPRRGERDGGEAALEEGLPSPSLEGAGQAGRKSIRFAPRHGRFGGFKAARSVTAPPHLTLVTSPPSKSAAKEIATPEPQPDIPAQEPQAVQPGSPAGSQDSFHSVQSQSWHSPITPLPPSPPMSSPGSPAVYPYPHENIALPKNNAHQRDASELTITPDTPQTARISTLTTQSRLSDEPSAGSTSTVDEELLADTSLAAPESRPTSGTEDSEPDSKATAAATGSNGSSTAVVQRQDVRHRATTSINRRRALSPLPPAANLFNPRQGYGNAGRSSLVQGKLAVVRRLPMAVIQKTCEILLSPPSHLINLMLKVAAKIAAGEWRGFVFGTGESGEEIPVQWDWSDDDGHEQLGGWGADDDFGFDGPGAWHRSRDSSVSDEPQARAPQAEGVSDPTGQLPSLAEKGEEAVSKSDGVVGPDAEADWARSWGVD